jgi:hypothetical protein
MSDSQMFEDLLGLQPPPPPPPSEVDALKTSIAELNNKIDYLHELYQAQSKLLEQQSLIIDAFKSRQYLPNLSPPEVYDGSPDKAQSFLNSVSLYFDGRRSEFTTDAAKISFVASYMKQGMAKAWIDQHMGDDVAITDSFSTWPIFLRAFKQEFNDPLASITARREIRALKQGSGKVADYTSKFNALIKQTGYEDITLKEIFEHGLTKAIQDKVYTLTHMPTTLKQWQEQARKFDEQDLQRKTNQEMFSPASEKKPNPFKNNFVNKPNPFQKPAATPSEAKTATGTLFGGSGQPMDLDAAKRQGLCFNCGGKGHLGKDCSSPKQKQVQVRQMDVRSFSKEEMEQMNKQWKDYHSTVEVDF